VPRAPPNAFRPAVTGAFILSIILPTVSNIAPNNPPLDPPEELGAEPADTCDINVTNGFLTFRTGKDGDKFLGIMVLDYIPIIDEDTNEVDDSAMQEIAPLDLPF
jgi:hypothetical protein